MPTGKQTNIIMKRNILILTAILLPAIAFSQKYTISGTIRDGTSGESLIGATTYIATLETGTTSNTYGFYSISAPASDSITVIFSYLGYEAQVKKIYFNKNYKLDIALAPAGVELEQVVVSSHRANDDNVQRAQMGVVDVPVKLIQSLPAILGETDVLKVIQLLPGVSAGQEGTTGFFVRGGNTDQNLVQLDEATVYNPNHLFGLFSTFNTKALNNVQLVKGGFSANYGGRLSSILDITMKDGNNQKFETEGGIGLISSQLTVQGPLKKDKASFIVSGRRTYLDLLLRPFLPKANKTNYYFYDINTKVNYQLSEKDRVYASFFTGRDEAQYTDATSVDFGLRFGNSTGTVRWNHIFGQKLFLNTSLIYDRYLLSLSTVQGKSYAQYYSGIDDYTGKAEFQYYPSPKHKVLFGAVFTNHKFTSAGKAAKVPKNLDIVNLNVNKIPPRWSNEAAVYVNDEWNITPKFGLNVGLRAPVYTTADTTYYRLEPRASVKYSLSKNASVKASYTLMNQFIHLVPSSTAALPTDIWTPSSKITKPQQAEQFAIGYFKNFQDNQIETSVEAYYKTMHNQVLFREGSQLLEQTDIDKELVFGKGWSYGIEFFVKKNYGRLNGWVSYTLSWTDQQFKDLNFGKTFPFKYDRRHNLSIVGAYDLSRRWTVSADFVFYSGSAYTLPGGRVLIATGGDLYEGNYSDYTERNNYRLRPYHRLDVAATYHKKSHLFGKKYDSEWVFSAYNIYSRRNDYFVHVTVDVNTNLPTATRVSLLPIIPSISYNFKF